MSSAKKNGVNSFAGLGRGLINDSQAPAPIEGKPYPVNFHVNPELVLPFERALFWAGRKYNKKTLMNEALDFYLKNHPAARERSLKPTPDEEPGQ